MNQPSVAILGCGPAGLLSAHAADLQGLRTTIISKKQKSVMPGAQYLHASIPYMTGDEPDGELAYVKRGTRDGYAEKLYGDPKAPCSWDHFEEGRVGVWNMGQMYNRLWERFETNIVDVTVLPKDIDAMMVDFDYVVSTIPAHKVCKYVGMHKFHSTTVYITPYIPHYIDIETSGDVIVYNGNQDEPWYRASRIFDHGSLEAVRPLRKHPEQVYGHKPIRTDCNCHAGYGERFARMGRFGQWSKGVLVHHVFDNATGHFKRAEARRAVH